MTTKHPKKEMEFEDAPSGYVTLYNYKEPFMRFQNGFGFLGVLLFDGESDKVQCHICGEWYISLPHHINAIHGMNASEYKQKVGLRQSTALIGEKLRSRLISKGLGKRMKNLRKGKKKSQEVRDKIRKTLQKNMLENKNLHGTCPEQLIDRLQKLCDELGRVPAHAEIPFVQALEMTFGSVANAVRMIGLTPRKPGQNIRKQNKSFTDEELLKILKDFHTRNGRIPSKSDMARHLLPHRDTYVRRFGSWNKVIKLIKK